MAILITNRRGRTVGTARLKKIATLICDALDVSDAELSILITDDSAIHELNKTWRDKDKPTDVLSFSQYEPEAPIVVLGDVVISIETAARQAETAGLSLDEEVVRLLIHGVLHLLGHDHVHGGHQARKMKDEEQRVLRAVEVG